VSSSSSTLAEASRARVVTLRREPPRRALLDARSAVALLVDAAVEIVTRAAPIYEVVRRASADPDVAALLDETRHRRRLDQRRLAEILTEAGHLDHAVNVNDAADVLYGLLNEELVGLLVQDCGWSTARLRAWLTDLLANQLLPDGSSPPDRAALLP
jgi:hypothetical protein